MKPSEAFLIWRKYDLNPIQSPPPGVAQVKPELIQLFANSSRHIKSLFCVYRMSLIRKVYFLREERMAHMLSMVPAMFMVSELLAISNFKAFYRYFKAVLYCCFLTYKEKKFLLFEETAHIIVG